jgi:hypothetical protein
VGGAAKHDAGVIELVDALEDELIEQRGRAPALEGGAGS